MSTTQKKQSQKKYLVLGDQSIPVEERPTETILTQIVSSHHSVVSPFTKKSHEPAALQKTPCPQYELKAVVDVIVSDIQAGLYDLHSASLAIDEINLVLTKDIDGSHSCLSGQNCSDAQGLACGNSCPSASGSLCGCGCAVAQGTACVSTQDGLKPQTRFFSTYFDVLHGLEPFVILFFHSNKARIVMDVARRTHKEKSDS